MSQIELIRREVERLIEESDFDESANLYSLLAFLSNLEEQTKEVHNPIFDECVSRVDPEVREEVRENIDFEQALYDHFGQVKDFTLGMRIGKYFYELGKQSGSSEIPNDLEEAADEYAYRGLPDEMKPYVKPVGDEIIKNFIAGAKWQAEQFEKNRLAACDNMSKEEYDRETDFVDSIIKKERRQPTFSDAINYGMRLQPLPEDTVIYQKGVEEGKRLMMEEAVEIGTTEIYWEPDGDRAFPTFDPPVEDLLMPDIISQRFNEGDKVRVIIVKE